MFDASDVVRPEEVIAAIRELAAELERTPTMSEVASKLNTTELRIRRLFGSYAKAVAASGLAPTVKGRLRMRDVFEDWRVVARKLGKIPTMYEYGLEGNLSIRPFKDRFGSWKNIPGGMLEFGDGAQLWPGWEDVRELAQRYVDKQARFTDVISRSTDVQADVHAKYGKPLTDSPMFTAPTNELGVMVLFGGLARRLGFVVLQVQAGFPDCEALREVTEDRWQRVRIEFEF